jgi:DNA-binding NarL/FixJ family response regulator
VALFDAGGQAANVTSLGCYRAGCGPAARGEAETILAALHGVALSRPALADIAVLCAAANRRSSPPAVVVLTGQAPTRRTLETLLRAGAEGILTWPLPGASCGCVLTVRQHQVLGTFTSGDTDTAAAGHLGISLASVKTELHALYRKLGVAGRAEACAAAFRAGLLA